MKLTEIRHQLRQERQQLSPSAVQIASQAVTLHLIASDFFQKSQRIATYMAFDNEIDPLPATLAAWSMGKACYLPCLAPFPGKTLSFARYQADTTCQTNRYGILEPSSTSAIWITPNALELVLMPLVGFDKVGNRLGTGAGYYDRTFNFLQQAIRPSQPYLVGLAYAWQQIEALTSQPWDIGLDAVVTEQGCWEFNPYLTCRS